MHAARPSQSVDGELPTSKIRRLLPPGNDASEERLRHPRSPLALVANPGHVLAQNWRIASPQLAWPPLAPALELADCRIFAEEETQVCHLANSLELADRSIFAEQERPVAAQPAGTSAPAATPSYLMAAPRLGFAGCLVFLCPLGGLSSTRRRLLDRRLRDAGGASCANSSAEALRDATHCVVDAALPAARFVREAYCLPASCSAVTDAWLSHSLAAGTCLPVDSYLAFRENAQCAFPASAVKHQGPWARPQHSASLAPADLVKADAAAGRAEQHGGVLEAVGLDCEFIGVGKNTAGIGGDRNALARVSVVASGGHVLLDTTVQVLEPIVDFRIHVTGLTQEALDRGVMPSVASAWVAHLIAGRIVVGHALSHDWKVLGLWHPPELVRDTARYSRLRPPAAEKKVASLAELSELCLGRTIQKGAHDSVEDAAAALDLYLKHRAEWDASLASAERLFATTRAHAPPAPTGEAPLGAAALVASAAAAVISCQPSGFNAQLAAEFERQAARPGAIRHAMLHYRRVSRTFSALPYAVESEIDLDRPELACLGKHGNHTRRLAIRVLETAVLQPAKGCLASPDVSTLPTPSNMK